MNTSSPTNRQSVRGSLFSPQRVPTCPTTGVMVPKNIEGMLDGKIVASENLPENIELFNPKEIFDRGCEYSDVVFIVPIDEKIGRALHGKTLNFSESLPLKKSNGKQEYSSGGCYLYAAEEPKSTVKFNNSNVFCPSKNESDEMKRTQRTISQKEFCPKVENNDTTTESELALE